MRCVRCGHDLGAAAPYAAKRAATNVQNEQRPFHKFLRLTPLFDVRCVGLRPVLPLELAPANTEGSAGRDHPLRPK